MKNNKFFLYNFAEKIMSYCQCCGSMIFGSQLLCQFCTCDKCKTPSLTNACKCSPSWPLGTTVVDSDIKHILPYRAGCIILCDHHFLLVQNVLGSWGFCKGHAESAHMFQEAARETLEKSGLHVNSDPNMRLWRCKDMFFFILFVSELSPLQPRDCQEIKDAKWFTMGDLRHLRLTLPVRKFIKFANK